MAKLPDETKTTILNLLGQLVVLIDEAAAAESAIAELFGETETTLTTLDDLQNARERLRVPYSRLCNLFLRVAEYQPTAPRDVLNLLYRTIEDTQATTAASKASISEAKGDFNLP